MTNPNDIDIFTEFVINTVENDTYIGGLIVNLKDEQNNIKETIKTNIRNKINELTETFIKEKLINKNNITLRQDNHPEESPINEQYISISMPLIRIVKCLFKLKETHNKNYKAIIKWFNDYNTSDKFTEAVRLGPIQTISFFIACNLFDIYAACRMCRYMDVQPIIVYVGDTHKERYDELFGKYLNLKKYEATNITEKTVAIDKKKLIPFYSKPQAAKKAKTAAPAIVPAVTAEPAESPRLEEESEEDLEDPISAPATVPEEYKDNETVEQYFNKKNTDFTIVLNKINESPKQKKLKKLKKLKN